MALDIEIDVDDVTLVRYGQVYRYTAVLMLALQIYEHFITFNMELTCFWKSARKLSIGQLLFITNRYLPYGLSVTASHALLVESNGPLCQAQLNTATCVSYFCYTIVVLILFRRVFVVWERRRPVFLLLFLTCLLASAAVLYSVVEYWKGSKGVILPGLERFHCFIIIENDKAWVLLVGTTFCDLLVLSAIFLRSRFSDYYANNTLMKTMVRDGVGYFFFNTAISAAHIFIVVASNTYIRSFFFLVQVPLQSVLCSRLHYHLHQVAYEDVRVHDTLTLTHIRFGGHTRARKRTTEFTTRFSMFDTTMAATTVPDVEGDAARAHARAHDVWEGDVR